MGELSGHSKALFSLYHIREQKQEENELCKIFCGTVESVNTLGEKVKLLVNKLL